MVNSKTKIWEIFFLSYSNFLIFMFPTYRTTRIIRNLAPGILIFSRAHFAEIKTKLAG